MMQATTAIFSAEPETWDADRSFTELLSRYRDSQAEQEKVFRSDLEEEFLDQAISRIELITSPFPTEACRVLLSPETIAGAVSF
jgi:hypothetical protein